MMTARSDQRFAPEEIGYADRFELTVPDPIDSIDQFVQQLALRQPSWLTRLSMGISGTGELARQTHDALDGPLAHDTERLANGDVGIGNWRIIERGEHHVVFFEDMRIMRYRLTYRLEGAHLVSAETDVVQQTRWAGPFYWGLARWGHRRFLPLMLRNAGGPGSTTVTIR